jgi:hypothetical protein
MKNFVLLVSMTLTGFSGFGQFAPPVGQIGTTAMKNDSSAFAEWATGCSVTRGYQDISDPGLGYASVGDSSMVIGMAGSNGVVSLGDGGSAVVTFADPIQNGAGYDFAVFENAFNDTYLELAFVEVSSDGINFFRFPATSNTQDTVQIGFGSVNAMQINNLAGKYRALYGTPFDLDELVSQAGLNVNNITHVKIIDVVGSIQNAYASYDQSGKKINDPWSTPFASSGFDLDAVGVINHVTGINDKFAITSKLNVFPNPLKDKANVQYYLDKSSNALITIVDLTGKCVGSYKKSDQFQGWQMMTISDLNLSDGIYFLKVETNSGIAVQKIVISNE